MARRTGRTSCTSTGRRAVSGLVAGRTAAAPCVISLQGILQASCRSSSPAARRRRWPAWSRARSSSRAGASSTGTSCSAGRRRARSRSCVGAGFFIGRTDWDRAALAAREPPATYYHCDEIMRPEFTAVRWTPQGHGGDDRLLDLERADGEGHGVPPGGRRGPAAARRPNADLRIAGVHPGSELDALVSPCRTTLGVPARLAGWAASMPRPLCAELETADVFAYPSHIDNSPNSLAEAMLVGTPIVAASVGGIPLARATARRASWTPRATPPLSPPQSRSARRPAGAARLSAAARGRLARHDPVTSPPARWTSTTSVGERSSAAVLGAPGATRPHARRRIPEQGLSAARRPSSGAGANPTHGDAFCRYAGRVARCGRPLAARRVDNT